jgi:hypothetical protein
MIQRLIWAAVVAIGLAACGRGAGREVAVASTTGAGPSPGEIAAQSIAVARCDHEQTCDNVGSGRAYTSRNACVDVLREKTRDELRTTECPAGIDETQLEKCLGEIREEKCRNPLDTVTRLSACRQTGLCVK